MHTTRLVSKSYEDMQPRNLELDDTGGLSSISGWCYEFGWCWLVFYLEAWPHTAIIQTFHHIIPQRLRFSCISPIYQNNSGHASVFSIRIIREASNRLRMEVKRTLGFPPDHLQPPFQLWVPALSNQQVFHTRICRHRTCKAAMSLIP
jgi:hypothetical protein